MGSDPVTVLCIVPSVCLTGYDDIGDGNADLRSAIVRTVATETSYGMLIDGYQLLHCSLRIHTKNIVSPTISPILYSNTLAP